MKLLALDTSSLACAAGVLHGERLVTRYELEPRQHTRLLMPMIRDVLSESGLSVSDLDAIVLGNGPGSFIGLRIAASVAQGLAYGASLDIAPVSSMAAVALAAGAASDIVVVAQDAHLDQVYLGIYRIGENNSVRHVVAERLHPQQEIAELAGLEGVIVAGSGWRRYPALLQRNREHVATVSDVQYPGAKELLELGVAALDAGLARPPEQVDPVYLREKVAAKPAVSGP